jgi:hypothetical protein
VRSATDPPVDGHPFALCLTHDVDRVRKTYQTLYYALRDRDPSHFRDLMPGAEPYWQFDEIRALEADLGVRSAFYFLDEQSLFRDRPPTEWLDPEAWKLYAARYEVTAPRLAEVINDLDDGGWEVGLHGSYDSYRDRSRLAAEKRTVERVLGREVTGGRQHYLNLDVPATWRHQRAVGLRYDASLGSSTEYGFAHGYDPIRPFDDAFVVFPLTLMEITLPDPGAEPSAARAVCDDLLAEARANGAVMTVLWHPRLFSEADFPGYRDCYRYLIERALELGAWVGPPAALYDQLDHPDGEPVGERDRGPTTGTGTGDQPWSPAADGARSPAPSEREPTPADGGPTDRRSNGGTPGSPGTADAGVERGEGSAGEGSAGERGEAQADRSGSQEPHVGAGTTAREDAEDG